MKRLLTGLLAMTVLLLSGCGDASISVVIPITLADPPTITSHQFTKNTATEFINGSVDFFAPDSDIDTITIAVFDSRGVLVTRTRTAVNLPRVSRGTIFFSIDYVTFPADTFTFSIFLTDFNGNSSNQIADTFRVP
jgi:hypothetical protein